MQVEIFIRSASPVNSAEMSRSWLQTPRLTTQRRYHAVPLRVSLSGVRLPLSLLIVTTISRVHQYFGSLSMLRPALLLFAWSIVMLVLEKKGPEFRTLKERPLRLFLALLVSAVLSAPFGISMGSSMAFLLNSYVKVIILACLVAMAVRSTDDLWTFIWAYVIGVGVLAFLASTIIHMEHTGSGFARLADGYTYDANDIGLVCITGVPLCFVTYRTSGRLGKGFSLAILALACAAIARTGSRGAFLGVLVIATSMLFLMRHIRWTRRSLIGIAGAIALIVAAPRGYMAQMSTVLNPSSDYNFNSPTGRLQVAERGIGYLKRNPFTGIGLGNFARAEGMLSEEALAAQDGGAGVKWSAPHNSFLEATVEMGILGGTLFVALVISGMATGRRLHRLLAKRVPPRGCALTLSLSLAECLPIAFISFAVSGFFLSFAYMDPVYLLSAFSAAAVALVRRLPRSAH